MCGNIGRCGFGSSLKLYNVCTYLEQQRLCCSIITGFVHILAIPSEWSIGQSRRFVWDVMSTGLDRLHSTRISGFTQPPCNVQAR